MAKHGKTYVESLAKVDRMREYTPHEAVKLVKETKRAKFDESVEVHFRTGLNVRHADEQLRGTIALPHGLGKEVKIAVFAKGDKAQRGRGGRRGRRRRRGPRRQRVQEGFMDFDVAIATPDMMPIVGRLGRILGPSGKMPNPKVGTVTMDVAKAVQESKAGKVEYRTDRTAIVHMTVGKTSFSDEQLLENYQAMHRRAHPRQAVRGQGQVHPHRDARVDAGPRHQGRPVAHQGPDRDGGWRSRVSAHFSRLSRDSGRALRRVSPG